MNMKDNVIRSRKEDHIRINLEEDVKSSINTGLDRYYFDHQALPELDLKEIDTNIHIFGKKQEVPIFISSMVGGTERSFEINVRLAQAANQFGIGLGVGSQRIGLDQPERMKFFDVRKYAPDVLLFANIGAIQLNYGLELVDIQRTIASIEADALIFHLNPLQEALQAEGDTNFSGLLQKMESICRSIDVPVVVKEVGWGISPQVARSLADIGVSAIDVAGAGGTSWSQVEKFRLEPGPVRDTASAFRDWGISTTSSIINVHENIKDIMIFASGGLRSGVDVAKCLALGADYCGFAGKLFRAAAESEKRLYEVIEEIIRGLRVCMFAAGAEDITHIKSTSLRVRTSEDFI